MNDEDPNEFENQDNQENTANGIIDFIYQRLFNYLVDIKNYSHHCVQSIIAKKPDIFADIEDLLNILQNFSNNPNNQLIISANKRIENILKKNPLGTILENEQPKIELMLIKEEQELYNKFYHNIHNHENLNFVSSAQYFGYLETLNQPIANFFDKVMVMDDNLEIRNNRLLLLHRLHKFMNKKCKLSELQL
jgi:glycyl-tRNA synthetase beta chain